MIHYHGGPISPNCVAAKVWAGRHALISFANKRQIDIACEVSQSFVLDNGAFTLWKQGGKIDWDKYYAWVEEWYRHPAFDWALIPDVIDGNEEDNDRLVRAWPFQKHLGVPVWHLHESLQRLQMLCVSWPRVALGSSGEWGTPGKSEWWSRMDQAMYAVCDANGQPLTKLHGLRMLNPAIFTRLPLASVDSSTIARNVNIDASWKGRFQPRSKEVRGLVMADRFEGYQSAPKWTSLMDQYEARAQSMQERLELEFGETEEQGENDE